jgi:hypothetical protein
MNTMKRKMKWIIADLINDMEPSEMTC